MNRERRRRLGLIATILLVALTIVSYGISGSETRQVEQPTASLQRQYDEASLTLEQLPVKGRASKTGYSRTQFGDGWTSMNGCDTRNIILNRDLVDVVVDENCLVTSGSLNDPYTGKVIEFRRGQDTSAVVQIDHVVALSDAWQKGAQQIGGEERIKLANDPLNLLAVSGPANQQKSDSDAASWLPPNKRFRCQYVSRQVMVKKKYNLWVTQAEKDTIVGVLSGCME